MMSRKMVLAGVAFILCGTAAAQAATLATPPIPNGVPVNHRMFCDVVSLDTEPRNVTTDIMDMNGVVVNTLGPLLIGPGQAFAVSDNTGAGAWCRFTVDGSAKKYRGLAVYDNGTLYTVSIPAQ